MISLIELTRKWLLRFTEVNEAQISYQACNSAYVILPIIAPEKYTYCQQRDELFSGLDKIIEIRMGVEDLERQHRTYPRVYSINIFGT